jgi:putative endonuclease
MGEQMHFVYVIISESTGKRYTGQTDDLDRRLLEHNSIEHNKRKHTSRNQGPWSLVYSEEHPTRGEAMCRENWLKSRSGRRFIDRQIGRASPAVLPD